MKPIWIVDDDPSIRFVLEKALARERLPVRSFVDAREVLAALDDECPQVLVSDIRMPGTSGLQLLDAVRQRLPALPVIVMTAYSDLDSAVSAFQGGAFEYLPKPFDIQKAVELIRRAVDESVREDVAAPASGPAPEMLGQAPAMQDVFRAIGRLSQSHATVLITGESGTGKELVAQALHRHSPRAQGAPATTGPAGDGRAPSAAARRAGDGPFIAINTAAIPKDLLESELFGHERGAFTGAQAMRRGRFEQADGGTLFLDEIGDMPLELQTRLLRVLADGQFYRVGGHHPVKVDVRVIAATHQDLEQRVRDGAFREDLFHRLNVIRLRLPPLRERREDIPMLAQRFLERSAKELGGEAKRLTPAALARLTAFDFPGNVRQLENVCHWLTVMAPSQVVDARDLPPDVLAGTSGPGAGPGGIAAADVGSAAGAGDRRAHDDPSSAWEGAGSGVADDAAGGQAFSSRHPAPSPAGDAERRAGMAEATAPPAPIAPSGSAGPVAPTSASAGLHDPAAPAQSAPTPDGPIGAPGPATAVNGHTTHDPALAAGGGTVDLEVGAGDSWLRELQAEAEQRLARGEPDVWDALTRQFESRLILTALHHTRGRRIEAAQRLGIGRNTITRKIQELRLGPL